MKQQKYKKKIKNATTTSMEKITNTSATTTKYKIFRKQDSPQKQKNSTASTETPQSPRKNTKIKFFNSST
jgi:hypothetical protein